MYFIYLFYFISFALKNTKKNHWRYANTSNKNEQYTNNNLNIWAGTPQQL